MIAIAGALRPGGLPALDAEQGVEARVGARFGTETLPDGLRVVIGQRPG